MNENPHLRDAYIDLLKKALTCGLWEGYDGSLISLRKRYRSRAMAWLARWNLILIKQTDPGARRQGKDWPYKAQTMIGLQRLENLQGCIRSVLQENIPGDFIETGVWRGGATIFMRGMLKAYGIQDRNVWVADSFAGLPPADLEKYPADAATPPAGLFTPLIVSRRQVEDNFRRYDLLDDQVRFLEGWFSQTLPSALIQRLAIARLDGDMYESTMDALVPLYPKLSPGGYLIVDDYHGWSGCRKAVDDYRRQNGITEPILKIDDEGVYWRKSK